MDWQDGSVGKGTANSEDLGLIPRNPYGRRRKTNPPSCPLTFLSVLLHTWACTHTVTETHTIHTHPHAPTFTLTQTLIHTYKHTLTQNADTHAHTQHADTHAHTQHADTRGDSIVEIQK